MPALSPLSPSRKLQARKAVVGILERLREEEAEEEGEREGEGLAAREGRIPREGERSVSQRG